MSETENPRYVLTHVDHDFDCTMSVQKINLSPLKFRYVPHQLKFHIPKNSGMTESNIAVFTHKNNGDTNIHIIMKMMYPNRRLSTKDSEYVSTSVGWITNLFNKHFNITKADIDKIAKSKTDINGKMKFSAMVPIKDVFWYTAYDSSRESQPLQTCYGICLSLNDLYNTVIVPNLTTIGK